MKLAAIKVSIFVALTTAFTITCFAGTSQQALSEFDWVEGELRQWRENTRAYMDRLPSKSGTSARLSRAAGSAADRERIFEAKGEFRTKFIAKHTRRHKVVSEIGTQDQPEDLINPKQGPGGEWLPILNRLQDMEERKLMSVRGEQPWSDSYWPAFQGVIAARYAAKGWPAYTNEWKTFKKFSETDVPVDSLSPVEKYELLFGNRARPLMREMWDLGAWYQKEYGKVETWIGICHGWSYAAYSMPRPKRAVTMYAEANGTAPVAVTFYPSDIKALGSYLWSDGDFDIRFVGTKCNEKNPPRDANGRIDPKFPECVDSNPGTWHISLVNEVGLRNRPVIFDSSFDYEVWNFPIFSYRYTYFNPATGRQVATLAEATVDAKFAGDKYAKYRSAEAKKIVGIAMSATVSNEQTPSHRTTDSASYDSLLTVRYLYDLELDADGKIIGGEWYQNAHPDFIWTVAPGTENKSIGDSVATSEWDGKTPPPADWQRGAAESAVNGALLSKAVKLLFDLSQ